MPKDNIKKLKELFEVMQNDTLTPAQAKKFLEYCLGFITTSKQSFEKTSTENLVALSEAVEYVEECKNDLCKRMDEMEEGADETFGNYDKRIGKIEKIQNSVNFDQRFKQLKEYTDEVLTQVQNAEAKPISVKDKKAIVDEVVEKLNKLDPEDVVEIITAINQLDPSNDDYKIDWSHIKNAPEYRGGHRVVSGGNRYLDKLANVNTRGKQDGWTIVWDEETQEWIAAPGGTGPGGNFADSEVVAGSVQTFTLANVPTAGSVHVYALGQRLKPTVDYTISAAVITTTLNWDAGDILADYRY